MQTDKLNTLIGGLKSTVPIAIEAPAANVTQNGLGMMIIKGSAQVK